MHLFLFISAAEIEISSQFRALCIIPIGMEVPDYSPVEVDTEKKLQISADLEFTESKSFFEKFPSEIITRSISFFDFKQAVKIFRSSKYLQYETEKALKCINNEQGGFDLTGLTRKDQLIVTLHLLPVFNTAFPGLIGRKMTAADLVCLNLLAFIFSADLKVEKKVQIFRALPGFIALQEALSAMDFISKYSTNMNNPVTSILKPGLFSSFLLSVVKSEKIPYTLEAIKILRNYDGPVLNNEFNAKGIVLNLFAVEMAAKDQRFFNNHLKSTPATDLVSDKIGKRHIIHELIVKKGEFNAEIFSRPDLAFVPFDSETNLSFYKAALVYSIKYENLSCLKGFLGFSNDHFPAFNENKLDSLRQGHFNIQIIPSFDIKSIIEYLTN